MATESKSSEAAPTPPEPISHQEPGDSLDHEGSARELAAALASLEGTRAAIERVRQEVAAELKAARQEVAEAQNALHLARSEMEQVRQERDHWHHQFVTHEDRGRHLESQIKNERLRNQDLNAELLDLYRDLSAQDLPSLILRIGVKLTGAENGLFIDQESNRTLADIGLSDLPPQIASALHEFANQVAIQDAPLVRNDSDQLPDGSNLVNLAAMPVAIHSAPTGVILVANKRKGPFTEDDTELLLAIGRHAGIAMENRRLHGALAQSYQSTIAVLADTVEAKDPYTRGHCEDVAIVAVSVAQRLGWQGDDLERIRYAALLHDIGKIGIPDGILLKPGHLLPEEFQVIQRHSLIGCDLVSRVPSLESIAPIILHHHERFDGSGYPDGLQGQDIPLGSRIVGAVDAWNAMTTPRPYRKPVSTPDAVAELRRCAGSQFDPDIIEIVADAIIERDKEMQEMQAA